MKRTTACDHSLLRLTLRQRLSPAGNPRGPCIPNPWVWTPPRSKPRPPSGNPARTTMGSHTDAPPRDVRLHLHPCKGQRACSWNTCRPINEWDWTQRHPAADHGVKEGFGWEVEGVQALVNDNISRRKLTQSTSRKTGPGTCETPP